MAKNRAFIKYNWYGIIVPGILVIRTRKPRGDEDWQEIPMTNCCSVPELPPPLIIGFRRIELADLLVGDASDVDSWNAYFNLPIAGEPFVSVSIVGNDVELFGGGNITLDDTLFDEDYIGAQTITKFIDQGGVIN